MSAFLRLVSVSDCERNGTLRITIPAPCTASAFCRPVNEPSGTRSRACSAASCARPASRDPIVIGNPARPSLTANPKPSAPVPPTMQTGAVNSTGSLCPALDL